MSRLAAEFHRLYAPAPDGAVRALILDVGRPADWDLLGAVWRGVQLDLSLPAPGIAIAGENSYQLWFSLRDGGSPEEVMAFLQGLRARYLSGVAEPRIRCLTTAPAVPAEVREGQWSAFVAPDLAPVFVEATWLDIPPGAEGQADLLKELKSISPQEWRDAKALLVPAGAQGRTSAQAASELPTPASFAAVSGFTEPRAFLFHVMNDPAVELALRIEAAKALLQAR